jgi:23S rRNA pseudouridine1911/1915/1917 synthase|tara:strand:+ start:3822 stop:4499 length:678 start_codon:yes stop_codon:yes gene_type:complete
MLEVIYEDNHLIAINKKSGDISQGDKTGDLPLSDYIKEYLKKKYNKLGNVYLGTIHRIDRPTSGVLVFAKTSKALSRMNELFRENKIQKTYWAVVKNQTPKTQGSLKNYLSKNNKQNKSYVCQENEGKLAELEYQTIKKLKNYYFLEIKPKTGRHHQIRVQLSNIGCPIKGDLKYGDKRSNKDQSIHLHARKIEFTHPVSKEILIITAPTPPDIIWNSITEDLHQ